MKLYFYNDEDFNIKALTTFGVSAKNSNDAIGFFGTGFKYAVAIILRLGGHIKITAHEKEYLFSVEKETFREKDFNIVHLNGENAGFTTHIGVNWEPWMAFRELYSNCKDEGGDCTNIKPEASVVIEVDCDEIYQAYLDKDEYFLTDAPIHILNNFELYEKPKDYIFYRGIAVRDVPKPSLFCYNIKDPMTLTEDRTAKYDSEWTWSITSGYGASNDKQLLSKVLTAPKDTFENELYFSGYVSREFIEVCRELLSKGIAINESARKILKRIDESAGNWPEIKLTKTQKTMLERATRFLERIDVRVDKFPIRVVDGLGDGVMGRALDRKIYLSKIPFDLGTKQVASTLLEEWVHNEHKCADFDRRMQSWLFDKILSIGEELIEEPL